MEVIAALKYIYVTISLFRLQFQIVTLYVILMFGRKLHFRIQDCAYRVCLGNTAHGLFRNVCVTVWTPQA